MSDFLMSGGGLIGNILQTRKIRENARMLGSTNERIAGLCGEIDELRLHLAVVISLLVRNGTVTGDAYRQLADAIDASDGMADGQFAGTITTDGATTTEPGLGNPGIRDTVQALRNMAAQADAPPPTDPSR